MKRLLFILTMLMATSIMLTAQEITLDAARARAAQFLTRHHSKACAAKKAPRKSPHLVLADDRDEFYVFNDEANGCFIIMSADERMPSILGYSDHSLFDSNNIPCGLNMLLEGYAEQVRHVRRQPMKKGDGREVEEWEEDYIAPMLSTSWNQAEPYYNQCPTIGGNHCVTGCEATAMAQIMAYYEWPKKTTQTIPGYTTETRQLKIPAIEPTTIDWENMLPTYQRNYYNDEQAEAVATLMKLCGASFKMDYNLYLSGGVGWSEAFVKYFDYDSEIRDIYLDDFEQYDWEKIIHNELHEGRPVMYVGNTGPGSGHVFVVDGYDGWEEEHLFHINMGWGGSSDGYYLLNSILKYTFYQHATINIYPNDPQRPRLPRAYGLIDNEQLTLYYDNQYQSHSEEALIPLQEIKGNEKIARCVIDPSLKEHTLTSLEGLFNGCKNLKGIIGLENLNTSMVTNMGSMFEGCSSLTSLDLSSFDTSKVTEMAGMFQGCSSLKSLDIGNFNTGKVNNMGQMFAGCSSLESLDLSSFDTSGVDTYYGMYCMFNGCSSLKSLDLSHFKTDKVKTFWLMFYNCSSLETLDISGFNIGSSDATYGMFRGCSSLTSLDLSSFNTENIKNMEMMFAECNNLKTIYVSDGWNTENVERSNFMFYSCSNLVGGAGTTFSWEHTDVEYAHIDGGPDNPGYLTEKDKTAIQPIKVIEYGEKEAYSISGLKINSDVKSSRPIIRIINRKKYLIN